MEADEILRWLTQLNRNLYQKKIADVAEAQSEQQQPTFYTGFDNQTGFARLTSSDGKKSYGKSQTNGAVGVGDSIRSRGDFYDSSPHRKLESPSVDINKTTPNTGLVIFRDINWLDIVSETNQEVFYKLIKYFLNKNTVYTIGADPRIYINPVYFPTDSETGTVFGILSFDGRRIPTNISQTLEEKNIKVKTINLKEKNSYLKVKSCFVLPLFNTSDYEFTGIEKNNLKQIAQRQGLIIISEWIFWDEYTKYLLQTFNLSGRIQTGDSYISVNWAKGGINGFKFPDSAMNNNATGTFTNVEESEKLLVINEPSGIFIGNDFEYIPEGEARAIPPKTASAIYIQSKDLK